MPTPTTLLSELQQSALAGDHVAQTVLENPLMGMLLKEFVDSPIPAYIRFDLSTVNLKLSDKKRRLIAGYASVETIDKQNELITLGALKKAWSRMRAAGEQYANMNLEHSNITIGKILLDERVTDSEGVEHWSQVDDKGLYVLCELRQDIDIADRVWAMANQGELNAFSIGGRILPGGKRMKMGTGIGAASSVNSEPFWEINDLELYEITVCKRGKNPLSGFSVLKSYWDMGLIDEATYIAKSDELRKGEAIVKELVLIPSLAGKSVTLSENFIGFRGWDIGKSDDQSIMILVKMDPEDPLRRFVEKSVLKMLPQPMWDHIKFQFEEVSVFPDQTQPLFNLSLTPVEISKAEPCKKEEDPKNKPVESSEEAKKSDLDTTVQSSEQSTVQTNSTLKKTDVEVATEDDKMSTPENKSEGTPGTATPIANADTVESLSLRLATIENQIKNGVPAPMPAPTGGTANPMSKEDKPCEKPEEDDVKACKAEPMDAELVLALEGFAAKGKVPPWLAEKMAAAKSVAKADPVAELKKSVDALMAKVDTIAKAETTIDVTAVATKVTELLKSQSQTIRKADAPQITPGEATPAAIGPKNLQDMHKMPWSEVDAESTRRRSQALA